MVDFAARQPRRAELPLNAAVETEMTVALRD
jgi:hypothetical protein